MTSPNGWMVKQKLWCIHTIKSHSNKKELTPAIYSMSESHVCDKWREPDSKGHMWQSGKGKTVRSENESLVAISCSQGGVDYKGMLRESFGKSLLFWLWR